MLDVLQDAKKARSPIRGTILQDMVKRRARGGTRGRASQGAGTVETRSPTCVGRAIAGGGLALDSGELASQFSTAVAAVNDAPLLWYWAIGIVNDPTASGRILGTLWRLVVVLACAAPASGCCSAPCAARSARWKPGAPADEHDPAETAEPNAEVQALRAEGEEAEAAQVHDAARARSHRFSITWKAFRRLPLVLVDLLLNLLPVAVFAALGNALLSTDLGDTENTRLVVMAVVERLRDRGPGHHVRHVRTWSSRRGTHRLRLIQCDDDTAA